MPTITLENIRHLIPDYEPVVLLSENKHRIQKNNYDWRTLYASFQGLQKEVSVQKIESYDEGIAIHVNQQEFLDAGRQHHYAVYPAYAIEAV